ncbi:hypothetical protein Q4Q39_02605 [Flavivirga amylovorans]|uniref:Fimbrial assembly protein n=1 Tax=Flavivirga amylovorans TaxID=870486 RepID=A0ABT8WX80_9FLAO|nr:hypothetical protein [Flavivirga amylovorans]MDO5986284.1 hypothetical protein [Flavivirga amylovorans]
MLRGIKTYLEYSNLFCGVEHSYKGGQDIIYTTLLKKKKKVLVVENRFEDLSFDKTISKLPKKQHICLIINNDHVLTKLIDSPETVALKIVYKAFPNIDLNDFYYEVLNQKKSQLVTICRKTYVDALVNHYSEDGFFVINVSLGNSIVYGISEFLKSQDIITSNATVSFENHAVYAIEKTQIKDNTIFNINGLEITNDYILSFSGALNTLLNKFNPVTNLDELTSSLKNNFKQTKFFNVFLKLGLVFILTILLINFFVFYYYFNEVKTLQQTSQVNQTAKAKILELNEHVTKSQKIVEDMLKGNSSKSSFYVNTLIQSLPNSILLTKLNYHPILKRIKSEQPITIDNNALLIGGESNDSELFSKWLADLENFNFVNKVDILNYEDLKSNSVFSLKLSINYDK